MFMLCVFVTGTSSIYIYRHHFVCVWNWKFDFDSVLVVDLVLDSRRCKRSLSIRLYVFAF